MAYFKTNVLDNQIKALPTIATASGAVATFTTDRGGYRLVDWTLDNSATTITRCGKNLFDLNNLTATGISISGGVASGTALTFNNNFGSVGVPNLKFKSNTVYSFSMKSYTDGNASTTGVGLVVGFVYTDNTNTLLSIQNSTTTETGFNFTSTSGKTVTKIIISFGSTGNNNWHLTDIQLEESETTTVYESYNGNTYAIADIENLKILNGYNNIYTDVGDISIDYILSVGQAIS